jgi:hypothetical protein
MLEPNRNLSGPIQERTMVGIKQAIVAAVAAAAIAVIPVTPAAAYGHGVGPVHGFGFGHGLAGAVFGLATLPLLLASEVISATAQASQQLAPAYGAPYGYATPNYGQSVSYGVAPYYYAPRPAYYPRAYGYSHARRSYYAPHSNYASAPAYRQRGSGYPHR